MHVWNVTRATSIEVNTLEFPKIKMNPTLKSSETFWGKWLLESRQRFREKLRENFLLGEQYVFYSWHDQV